MTSKTQKTITVSTDEENPIPVEIVADSILSISDAIKKFNDSRLSRRAILVLIQDNCKPAGNGFNKKPVNMKTVEAVWDSIQSLRKAYIKN